MATLTELPGLILAEAAKSGGNVWTQSQAAMQFYVGGYVKSLADIAAGVAKKEISASQARQYAKNATFLLAQGVANMAQILFFQVQQSINKVIGMLKTTINAALPFPVL